MTKPDFKNDNNIQIIESQMRFLVEHDYLPPSSVLTMYLREISAGAYKGHGRSDLEALSIAFTDDELEGIIADQKINKPEEFFYLLCPEKAEWNRMGENERLRWKIEVSLLLDELQLGNFKFDQPGKATITIRSFMRDANNPPNRTFKSLPAIFQKAANVARAKLFYENSADDWILQVPKLDAIRKF